MDDSLDWLPSDEDQEASCARTDATLWAAAFGLVVIVFVGVPLAESAMPLRAIGFVLGVLSAIYLWRVVRVRVTVDTDGVRVRGIATGRRLTWNDVVAVETTDGPSWMSFASWRPQGSRRITQRSATSTVLHLRDGTTLRPLALTRSLPSRSAERVTRLAQRFTSEA